MIDENIDILYAIERNVALCYRDNPAITDHIVKRVYESLAERYRALATGREPKSEAWDGAEANITNRLLEVCGEMREQGVLPMRSKPTQSPPRSAPVSAETLQRCLKRLVRSVDKATRRRGVRGYVDFISEYTR